MKLKILVTYQESPRSSYIPKETAYGALNSAIVK